MTYQTNDALVQRFAEAITALVEDGLAFARRDDPHVYAQAVKMIESKEAQLQLRVDYSTPPKTTAYLIDSDGDPVLQLFQLVGGHDPKALRQ